MADNPPNKEFGKRRVRLPEPLPLPLEELRLLLHAVLACTVGSVPGGGGSQCCRGISV